MSNAALQKLESAAAAANITPEAAASIRRWLTEPRYADYAAEVERQIDAGLWKQLDDAFWTVIPFGTGGRRGKMYPIGSNTINDRTIGESAQGVADYVARVHAKANGGGADGLRCAIAYDTRHRSRHFAELCGEIMVAAGFHVFFLDGYPQHARAVVHRAAFWLPLRPDDHRQPQSAERQRDQSLLVHAADKYCRRTMRASSSAC